MKRWPFDDDDPPAKSFPDRTTNAVSEQDLRNLRKKKRERKKAGFTPRTITNALSADVDAYLAQGKRKDSEC